MNCTQCDQGHITNVYVDRMDVYGYCDCQHLGDTMTVRSVPNSWGVRLRPCYLGPGPDELPPW